MSAPDHYQLAAEHAVDGLLVVDEAGTVVYANPAASARLGIPCPGLVGSRLPFALPPHRPGRTVAAAGYPGGRPAEVLVHRVNGAHPRDVVVLREVSGEHRLREVLKAMALLDDLTGLYNQRGFLLLTQQLIKLSIRHVRPLALLLLKLEGLPGLEQAAGRPARDMAVLDLANTLKTTFRESDVLGRWREDSFAVLAVEADPHTLSGLLQRLDGYVASSGRLRSAGNAVSLNIGVARGEPGRGVTLDALFEEAEAAVKTAAPSQPNGGISFTEP